MADDALRSDDDGLVLGWAVESLVDYASALADAHGGAIARWDDVMAADGASACFFLNNAVLVRPMIESSAPALVRRLDSHYAVAAGGPYLVWSAWPTPDLREHGFELIGHPPVMFRPVGGVPAPMPPGLEIREATDAAALEDAEQVGILGYPLPMVDAGNAGVLLPPPVLDGPVRTWVGYVDGTPVATAGVITTADVNLVEFVATMPEHRGKGYGEALTWAATLADPTKPGLLEASDLGRPVYERMGYVGISRMTLWLRPRPSG